MAVQTIGLIMFNMAVAYSVRLTLVACVEELVHSGSQEN